MNALEEIQAAIEKLTAERDATGIDALDYDTGDATLYSPIDGDSLFIFRAHEDGIMPLTGTPDPDTFALAELLVTLHRTIDAQLALLRAAEGDAAGSHDEPGAFENALALARAITGSKQ